MGGDTEWVDTEWVETTCTCLHVERQRSMFVVRIGRLGGWVTSILCICPILTPRRPYPFLPPRFLSITPLHTPSCPLPPFNPPYPPYPAVTLNTQFVKSTISLLGCRANPLNRLAQEKIGKQGAAGKGCLQLNCTSHLRQYYLCAPPGARPGYDMNYLYNIQCSEIFNTDN